MNEARPTVIAAVDLGSNSFHLLVARNDGGRLIVVDRLKEMVQLASGMNASGRLDDATASLGIECLQRFNQRLRDIDPAGIRAVGTNTFRRIRDGGKYLGQARQALGQPIEIISGIEEARLIYSGVANSMSFDETERLVVDIGGGSTELIIGSGLSAQHLESLYMGCVGLSMKHFPDGKISRRRINKARIDARLEVENVVSVLRGGFTEAVGSSGTVRATQTATASLGLDPHKVTLPDVETLIEQMIDAGDADKLSYPDVEPRRLRVMPGGVAILAEVMSILDVDSMSVSDNALRDGVLYDLIGRMADDDARENTVRNLEKRIQAYRLQSRRVENLAADLLAQLSDAWGLDNPACRKFLSWAARLHEIGLDIAHAKYHVHGAYFLQHADLPGFPRDEQLLLSRLVRGHRRRLQDPVADLPADMQEKAQRLIVILRLAVLLNRGRSDEPMPEIRASAQGTTVRLSFEDDWLSEQPLTREDLRRETNYLAEVGYRLKVGSR